MQKTLFPLKKTFEKDFINSKWKLLFTLRYDQATLKEYYEFINKDSVSQFEELYKILKKSITYWLFTRLLQKVNKNYRPAWENDLNISSITNDIMVNRYRIYKSIFEGLRIENKKKWAIESVVLSSICEKYNVSPNELMEKYTLEQYFWFLDWLERIWNSYSKEWEIINQKALIDKEAIKKRAEETKAKFLKFKKISW
jgi:hypothetical protein